MHTCIHVCRRRSDMGRLLGKSNFLVRESYFPQFGRGDKEGGSDFNSDNFGINNVPG